MSKIRLSAAPFAMLVLASVSLSACGGSSGKSSTATNASQTSSPGTSSTQSNAPGGPRGAGGPAGAGGARFAAMRECLKKNGVELPQPKAGERGGFLRGGTLPKGTTRAKLQSALSKCGGGRAAGAPRFGTRDRAGLQKAFAKFATCMRSNGVNVPTPNTSGKGPIFSTKGLNTQSSQFKSATKKCRPVLSSAFPRRGAAPGQPGAGGPPAGGTPPAE